MLLWLGEGVRVKRPKKKFVNFGGKNFRRKPIKHMKVIQTVIFFHCTLI